MIIKSECCCTLPRCDADMVRCPACGSTGQAVPRETVKSLVGTDIPETEKFGVCLTSGCDVVYFSLGGAFHQAEVRIPIAWKDGASPKYVCYCNRVTEDEIIRSVTEHGAKTVAEVAKATGAMKNGKCLGSNPKGTCCHTDIEKIIKLG